MKRHPSLVACCRTTRIFFGFLGLVMMMIVPVQVHSTWAANASHQHAGFCKARQTRNYLKPLERMVPVRHVPRSGRLPFGPKGVSLYAIGNGLLAGKGSVGFAFSDRAVNQRRRLNWFVRSKLSRVNYRGHVEAVLATRTRYVGRRKVDRVSGQRFMVSGRPSFYRVDIAIARRNGVRLGRYSEYFRVMSPKSNVRLSVSSRSVISGQEVYARVENIGTESVLPSGRVYIERYNGTAWEGIGSTTIPGQRTRVRAVLFGGEVGPCVKYKVPEGQPEGLYRLTDYVDRLKSGSGSRRTLVARFQVTSPAVVN